MGIHNEPGFAHIKPYPPLPELVGQMLSSLTSTIERDPERGFLQNLKYDGKDEGELTPYFSHGPSTQYFPQLPFWSIILAPLANSKWVALLKKVSSPTPVLST